VADLIGTPSHAIGDLGEPCEKGWVLRNVHGILRSVNGVSAFIVYNVIGVSYSIGPFYRFLRHGGTVADSVGKASEMPTP